LPLDCRLPSPPKPRRLSGDPRRAVIRMTPLRLNAADGHHRFATDVDGIAAQSKCEHRRLWHSELAGHDEDAALVQAMRREDLLHAAEAHLERERDMIGEDQRPGAGAA